MATAESHVHAHQPHGPPVTRSQVYGVRTRSRAVEIFTTCAHMVCNMEELEKVSAPPPRSLACPALWRDVLGARQPCL